MLAMVSVWSPRRIEIKVGAVVVAFALMATHLCGHAGPAQQAQAGELRVVASRAAEATVVGSSLDESRAIYVWLQLDGVPEPRAYALPWDQRVAEQLQAAARTAAERQSAVRMRLPFETTLDDREPRFYALPQPAMPPKDATRPPAQVIVPPGTNA